MRLYIITDLTEINLQKNPANTPLQFDSLNFFAQKFTRDENERSADVGMTGKVWAIFSYELKPRRGFLGFFVVYIL